MKKIKTHFAFLLAVLILSLSFTSAFCAEMPQIRFAVLGDSIASGYGLKNTLDCYASTIAANKSYHLTNDAVPGHTTENLLQVVCYSANARKSIEEADLISVSICGNDLIQLLTSADTGTLMDIALKGVKAKAVTETAEKITFNLQSVCKEIRVLNPDAPIIFQNLYNPLYSNEQYASYASFAEMFVPVLDEILSSLCKNYANVFTADVHGAFDAYYKETGIYDVIQPDGIHPSEKGHALIAEVLLEEINKLEEAGLVPTAAKYYFMLGDADGNNKLTISDATVIQKIIAGILASNNDIAKARLDADQNDAVNIKDATMIQKHLADLPSNPNIGNYLPFYD